MRYNQIMNVLTTSPNSAVTLPLPYFKDFITEMGRNKAFLEHKISQASFIAKSLVSTGSQGDLQHANYSDFKKQLIQTLIYHKEEREALDMCVEKLEEKVESLKNYYAEQVKRRHTIYSTDTIVDYINRTAGQNSNFTKNIKDIRDNNVSNFLSDKFDHFTLNGAVQDDLGLSIRVGKGI